MKLDKAHVDQMIGELQSKNDSLRAALHEILDKAIESDTEKISVSDALSALTDIRYTAANALVICPNCGEVWMAHNDDGSCVTSEDNICLDCGGDKEFVARDRARCDCKEKENVSLS